MPATFYRGPLVKALQFLGHNHAEVEMWLGDRAETFFQVEVGRPQNEWKPRSCRIIVNHAGKGVFVDIGDWIVKGQPGGFDDEYRVFADEDFRAWFFPHSPSSDPAAVQETVQSEAA